MVYFCLLVIMTLLGSVAALFLKKASAYKGIKKILSNSNLYIGGGLYFIAALINIFVLQYLNYSTVLPLTSLTYIWTMLLSRFVLKEKISIQKSIGVVGILIGSMLIAMV
ncbi:permease [Spirochaetia bacterium]|nr:permease [Spirochaetia bacterium]